jgi:hypothetical protein
MKETNYIFRVNSKCHRNQRDVEDLSKKDREACAHTATNLSHPQNCSLKF